MDLALGLGAASGLVKEKRSERGCGNWEQIMGVSNAKQSSDFIVRTLGSHAGL